MLALFAAVLVPVFAIYALLTRGRRKTICLIRSQSAERGWKFHRRHLAGDAASFRIHGRTGDGLPWIMSSSGASNYNNGWSIRLALRFPDLGGHTDFALVPRTFAGRAASVPAAVPEKLRERIAKFSGTLAGAIDFVEHAKEFPAGDSAFDAAYEVLALPGFNQRSPLDAR
jgi:hypothetical protein